MESYTLYIGKDNRVRIYDKETKKVSSYPKYIMEKFLGRKLEKDEEVHHINENTLDNEISNLEVRHKGEHQRYHSRNRRLVDTIERCCVCGKEFIVTAKQHRTRRKKSHKKEALITGLYFCSRRCSGTYGQGIQMATKSHESGGS